MADEGTHDEGRAHEADLAGLRAELEASRAEEVRTLAAAVGHALRNPLAALRNAHYFLANERAADGQLLTKYLSLMDREIGTADRIIGDLLDFASRDPLVPSSCPVRQLFDAALGATRGRDSLVMDNRAPEELPIPTWDWEVCVRFLACLLDNASEAAPGRTVNVVVEARIEGTIVALTVADDGPGVPAHLRDRLFEPLVTTKARGSGLGLAIAKASVTRHGGTIELAPATRGAAFAIRMPFTVR